MIKMTITYASSCGYMKVGFLKQCFGFEFMVFSFTMSNVWPCGLIVHNELGEVGEGTFCLLEYGMKFRTKCGVVFLFQVDKVLHCSIKKQCGNQFGMAFF